MVQNREPAFWRVPVDQQSVVEDRFRKSPSVHRLCGIMRIMNRLSLLAIIVVGLLAMPSGGFAQWLHYPTDGLPRKADGTPNLTGPAPRLPDGKPDLSGLWHASQPNRCTNARGEPIPCGIEIGG